MTTAPPTIFQYQRWSGQLRTGRWTWGVIVMTGIRLALKNARTRGLITSGAIFILGSCTIFYVLSVLETLVGTPQAEGIYDFVQTVLGVDISGVSRLEEYRELLWRCVFLLMIKIQLLWVLLMATRVGPGLIADDIKARALPIYFAKPITPLTYLVGKWMVVGAFIAVVTAVPNLLSLIIGTVITDGVGTWRQTLDLGWDLLVSGVGVSVVGGMIILALSSLTSDRRYAIGAWLAVCLLLLSAQAIVNNALPQQSSEGFLGCISLRDNVVVLTNWLFGMRQAWEASGLPTEAFSRALVKPVPASCAAAVMAVWTVAAILICYRQIVRFSRQAANV
jgi:ABC-type transport system involved in multi-copper enzyme maturation permease subunit